VIDKSKSELISRRRALSFLGIGGGLSVAASSVPNVSATETAGMENRQQRRKVALALQGGGSHGAFTRGVLDRLLDETTIDIIGVTGASAGAMNGAVLVDGLVRGGTKQARVQLRPLLGSGRCHARSRQPFLR
jgi:hypothetical protein